MSKIISIHTKEHIHISNRECIDLGKLVNYSSEMKHILRLIEQSLENTSIHASKDPNS